MPKQGTRAEVNTFVQGIITEASPLNFPPNATLDEQNFELNRNGTRNRRLGINLDSTTPLRSRTSLVNFPTRAVNFYRWEAAGGDPTKDFAVVQIGAALNFYDLNNNMAWVGEVWINRVEDTRYSFATVAGRLVAVDGSGVNYAISYSTSGGLAYTQFSLKSRDIWGVEETGPSETDPTWRPSGADINAYSKYNRVNQSWGLPRRDKATGAYTNPLKLFYNFNSNRWPSNTEKVWTGMEYIPSTSGSDPYEAVVVSRYGESKNASSSISRGYFIIDLLLRGISRTNAFNTNGVKYPDMTYGSTIESDFNNITLRQDSTSGGARTVTEFAGRIFYAGFNGDGTGMDSHSPNLANHVAFSQIVKNTTDLEKCYQEGDPTARDDTDLVDTDGGLIRIAGAKRIVALKNMQSHLVVIATNGVWTITGGAEYGFSATNYKVSKISEYGGLSESSVVADGANLFYWSGDGIYVVSKDQFGDLVVQNVSVSTIQSLYNTISLTAKTKATGVYDPYSKKIKWIYKEGTVFTSSSVTKELIFDTTLKAFYVNRFYNPTSNGVEVMGAIYTGFVSLDSGYYVQSLKYLTITKDLGGDSNVFIRFSNYSDMSFLDWKAYDNVGQDAKAYLLTGAQIAGDSAIDKQIPYLVIHFLRTENGVDVNGDLTKKSSCFIRSMWEWASDAVSKKWGPLFQAYRYNRAMLTDGTFSTGFDIISSKNKLRGRGKAFSLYMETEPGKDCRILGWNITLNGNAVT